MLLSSNITVADTFDLEFSKSFPFPIGSGPVGCSETLQKQHCTTAALTQPPDVAVEILAGNAQLVGIDLKQPNCAVITMRLWVDHKGYEGRQCLAPLARAIAHIELPTPLVLDGEKK